MLYWQSHQGERKKEIKVAAQKLLSNAGWRVCRYTLRLLSVARLVGHWIFTSTLNFFQILIKMHFCPLMSTYLLSPPLWNSHPLFHIPLRFFRIFITPLPWTAQRTPSGCVGTRHPTSTFWPNYPLSVNTAQPWYFRDEPNREPCLFVTCKTRASVFLRASVCCCPLTRINDEMMQWWNVCVFFPSPHDLIMCCVSLSVPQRLRVRYVRWCGQCR